MSERIIINFKKDRFKKALHNIFVCFVCFLFFVFLDFYYLNLDFQERLGAYAFLFVFFTSFYFFIIKDMLAKKGFFEFRLTCDEIFYRNGDVVFDRKVSDIKSLVDRGYASEGVVDSQIIEFIDGEYYDITEFFNYGLSYKKIFKEIKKLNPNVELHNQKHY